MPSSSMGRGTTFHSRLSAAISRGETAMKATTRPEPTVCSATAVPPMPPPSISAPMSRACTHCRGVGQGARRTQRIQAASSRPATTKRLPICRKGGKLSSAHLMAR
jgi:hypothetical protein